MVFNPTLNNISVFRQENLGEFQIYQYFIISSVVSQM